MKQPNTLSKRNNYQKSYFSHILKIKRVNTNAHFHCRTDQLCLDVFMFDYGVVSSIRVLVLTFTIVTDYCLGVKPASIHKFVTSPYNSKELFE